MEMESSRRPPFDRSRDLISKKPRLSEEPTRQFQAPLQRPPVIGSSLSRFRANNREPPAQADDLVRGTLQQHQELINQYKTALAELTFNSKPIITNLTIIAGENLQAAKAIAGTICANIIEVPSEQKLPSLYLLDSIVKNIGRDYIKHFAAKLPEVFCKAYRQVDPSIHPGMQHLFGTWKGVFPLQPLQLIEKELGFSASVNGPSSGTTTSKSDSQSQRQPHGIHVNPKYLEARQRLQQSSKMKSADISLTDVGSSEDVERPERTADAGTERLWMDPSAKLHSLRPQREPIREPSLQKQGGGVYGDFDFAPGLTRSLSTSVGKPSERVSGQRWLGGSREVEESISGQRNGYDVKRGIPSYAAVRPAINIPSISNQPRTAADISRSWKNSEEEEFMWDDLDTKVDPGATAVTKKDIWSEDLERAELGNVPKWQSQSEVRSHFEREHSADTSSSEQKEHLPFGHPRTSHLYSVGVSSFGFPSTTIPASTGILPSAGQSFINPRPPSSLSKRDPRQNMVEKDHLRSYSFARSDPRAATFSGQLNSGVRDKKFQDSIPSPLPNLNVQKLQQKPSSPTPSFQQRHDIPPSEQKLSSSETELSGIVQKAQQLLGSSSLKKGAPLESLNPVTSNTQGQSNVSDLLAAVMKTGLLSGTAVKVEKPPLVPPVTSSPTSSALTQSLNLAAAKTNPISILNTLLSKGLISAPKTEAPASVSVKSEGLLLEQSPTVSEVSGALPEPKPSSEKVSSLKPDGKRSNTILSTEEEVKDLIGFQFMPRVLRDFHPAIIDRLYDNLAHMCSECGVRFKLQERLARHSEWHALKNSISNCFNKPSRRWYSNSREWISGKSGFPFGYKSSCLMEGPHRTREQDEKLVPADESQCVCLLCGELFEDFYSQEKDEWMFKGAVYLSTLSGSTEGKSCSESGLQNLIVHADCMSGDSGHDLKLIKGIKLEKGT